MKYIYTPEESEESSNPHGRAHKSKTEAEDPKIAPGRREKDEQRSIEDVVGPDPQRSH